MAISNSGAARVQMGGFSKPGSKKKPKKKKAQTKPRKGKK